MGIYLKKAKTLIQKDMHTNVPCSIILQITAKIWKHLKCLSIHEWIKKIGIYADNGILFSIKYEILPFVRTWMDLEGIMLRETSQSKTNTRKSYSYVESKKQDK